MRELVRVDRKHLEATANLDAELSINQLMSLSNTLKILQSLMSETDTDTKTCVSDSGRQY